MLTKNMAAGLSLLGLIGCGRGDYSKYVSPDDPLARDVTIAKLTFNQGVAHVLRDTQYGKPFGQPAVVQDREGLLQVAVDVDDDVWEPREILAVLEFNGVRGPRRFVHSLFVEGDGRLPNPDTTFDFDVPAELVHEGSFFTVTLHEVDPSDDEGEADEEARFDLRDDPWTVIETGGVNLHLIPIRYEADGSGRTPDLNPARAAEYAAAMRAMYPVTHVEVTVEPPMSWGSTILPGGGGWSTILGAISAMRAENSDLPANTYFYAVFEPASSEADFCATGSCILGLSPVGTLTDEDSRASIGLGFPGPMSVETMVHEVGHAHGRLHAPCGLYGQSSDPGYPHSNAALGTWGWDINTGELIDPNEGRDMMSYCGPMWVSDYTWYHLAERTAALNSPASMNRSEAVTSSWQRLAVETDGSVVAIGEPRLRDRAPVGKPLEVRVIDSDGERIELARWFPSSHIDGAGMLLVETDHWDLDTKVLLD